MSDHDHDNCWDDECEECWEEGYDEGWHDGRKSARRHSGRPHSSSSSEGCYVATAVYGSYDCPEVWVLRRFRDYSLSKTWLGRTLIHAYYAVSPKLVSIFGRATWFQKIARTKLDRVVSVLREKGVDDSPYEDINWR